MSTSVAHAFSGVPSFFRGCCHTAAQGGAVGYDHPARELTRHLRRLSPHSVEDDEWNVEVDRLIELVAGNNLAAAIQWFVDHYPKCMALVPKRRREVFIASVRDSLVEFEEMEWPADPVQVANAPAVGTHEQRIADLKRRLADFDARPESEAMHDRQQRVFVRQDLVNELKRAEHAAEMARRERFSAEALRDSMLGALNHSGGQHGGQTKPSAE